MRYRRVDGILDNMTENRHYGSMDLSNPLRAIAPTLDAEVLAVLARTESPLSLAAIARLSRRGSRMGLHDAARRLVEQGLLSESPGGRGPMYRLERRHL